MAGYSFYPLNLRQWLLGMGRQLQAEYDDAVGAAPVPERIAALLKQLETASDAPAELSRHPPTERRMG
jgi:hypothetical protein